MKIKNIEHEKVLALAGQIDVLPGQVISRTLAQNSAVSVTLFAFAKGEEIGAHESAGDAMATVIEGRGTFVIDGRTYSAGAGEAIVMPAGKPHGIIAGEAFKMLLVVVF